MKNQTLFLLAFCHFLLFVVIAKAQESTIARLDSLERLLPLEKDPAKRCSLYNGVAFEYINFDLQKAHAYALKAFELAREHQLVVQMGRASNNLASYYLSKSVLDSAIQFYEKSLEYYRQAGDERGIADVLGNMGMVYESKGDYTRSLDLNLESLRKFEQLNVRNGMANQSLAIGSVYMAMGQFERAIRYDSVALHLYQELGDQYGEAVTLGNLANIYSDQGDLARAKPAYLGAVAVFEKAGSPVGVGRNLCNLGTLYHNEGNYRGALEVLTRARDMLKAADLPYEYRYAVGNMGVSYWLSYNNFDRRDSAFQLVPGRRSDLLRLSIPLLEESVELCRDAGDLKALQSFSQFLSKAHEAAGNPAKALEYYKIYTATGDSLQSVEAYRAIEQITTEREVELKNKQIELDRLAVAKKRNERVYFLIGIGLLLLSVLFIYRNYANQKHSNVLLAGLNQRISETNQELATRNTQLSDTLETLKQTQEQLIESEKHKENALIRSRISQDIHDDISSGLTKISWLAEAFMAKTAQSQAPADLSLLEKINTYARNTVSKLGEIIWASNPVHDNLESLLAYMRKYVANYMEDAPMRWRVEFPDQIPDLPLHPELRRNLYLVMKEALHNARKYSQAQEIVVAFHLDANACRLEVRDNGVGMAPGVIQGGGNGLQNMRRRMEAVGGHVEIVSAPGEGTVVCAECSIRSTEPR